MHSSRYSPYRLPGRTPAPDCALLERALRRTVVVGAVLVLLLPAARGQSAWLGALPLWLLGMPLSSWWALRRFPLPSWPMPMAAPGLLRRRMRRAQARRRTSPVGSGPSTV